MALFNRSKFAATTSGTGAFGVGAAATGFRTPANSGAYDGVAVSYTAQSADTLQWEYGHGIYHSAGPTISRDEILGSSNADAVVNFTLAPTVYLDILAEDVREVLTADRTYYVDGSTGSDSNPGTALLPWATVQYASDFVANTLDCGIYRITIQIADGTYPEQVTVRALVSQSSFPHLRILGNPTDNSLVRIAPVGDIADGGDGIFQFDGASCEVLNLFVDGSDVTGFADLFLSTFSKTSITGCRFGNVQGGGHFVEANGAGSFLSVGDSGDLPMVIAADADIGAFFDLGHGVNLSYDVYRTGLQIENDFACTAFLFLLDSTAFFYDDCLPVAGPGVVTGPKLQITQGGVVLNQTNSFDIFPGDSVGTIDETSSYNGAQGIAQLDDAPTAESLPLDTYQAIRSPLLAGGAAMVANDKDVLKYIGFQESVTEDRDYFIDGATGSDSNPGTEAEPWATIGHAENVISVGLIILPGVHINLYVAAGTYAESIIVKKPNSVSVIGADRDTTIIQPTDALGTCVSIEVGARGWDFSGLTLDASASTAGASGNISFRSGAQAEFYDIRIKGGFGDVELIFGANAITEIGELIVEDGDGASLLSFYGVSYVELYGTTTLDGAATFGTTIAVGATTFVSASCDWAGDGSTGQRFAVGGGAQLYTGGGTVDDIPGTIPGTVEPGGIYNGGVGFQSIDAPPTAADFPDNTWQAVRDDSTSDSLAIVANDQNVKKIIRFQEVVTADREYFVDGATGSDSNDGLTALTPWATIQHGIDVVNNLIQTNTEVHIYVAAGTYVEGLTFSYSTGGNGVRIVGADRDTTIIAPASGPVLNIRRAVTGWELEAVTFVPSDDDGVILYANSRIGIFGCRILGCAPGGQIFNNNLGYVEIIELVVENGTGVNLFTTDSGSYVIAGAIDFDGAAAFDITARARLPGAIIDLSDATFTGSAVTGQRFSADGGDIIIPDGAGIDFIPGDVDGTVTNGGSYGGAEAFRTLAAVVTAADLPEGTSQDIYDETGGGSLARYAVIGGVLARVRLRRVVSTDQDFYVDPATGSDSNPGTIGEPFATIQYAVDHVCDDFEYDPNIVPTVLIHLADGDYPEGDVYLRGTVGDADLNIVGNVATPSNVSVIPAVPGSYVFYSDDTQWNISGLRAGGSTYVMGASGAGSIFGTFIDFYFDINTVYGPFSDKGGYIEVGEGCSISTDGAMDPSYFIAIEEGGIQNHSGEWTVNDPINFSSSFMSLDTFGRLSFDATFINFGDITAGASYRINVNSTLILSGPPYDVAVIPGGSPGQIDGSSNISGFFGITVLDTAPTTDDIPEGAGAWVKETDSGDVQYSANDGGDIRRATPFTRYVGTQFDKTLNTTLGNVTDLTANVIAGGVYEFQAFLFTTSNVAGGVKAAIGGTATATAVIYQGVTTSTTTIGANDRATALGTAVGGATTVTVACIEIKGTIEVDAGGTLTVQFAQNASNAAASSVLVGSYFNVQQV